MFSDIPVAVAVVVFIDSLILLSLYLKILTKFAVEISGAGVYFDCCSMKRFGVMLIPPTGVASPSQAYFQYFVRMLCQ